jgi:hypothetical protein
MPVPPPYCHQPPHPHQAKTAARLSRSQIRGGSSPSHHEENGQGRLAGDLAPGPPPRHASTLRRPDRRRPEHAPPRRPKPACAPPPVAARGRTPAHRSCPTCSRPRPRPSRTPPHLPPAPWLAGRHGRPPPKIEQRPQKRPPAATIPGAPGFAGVPSGGGDAGGGWEEALVAAAARVPPCHQRRATRGWWVGMGRILECSEVEILFAVKLSWSPLNTPLNRIAFNIYFIDQGKGAG